MEEHKKDNISSCMNKALFLDRDGVINIDKGYVYRKDDFEFIDGIFDLVKEANKKNYKVIVITNQAGIGRGFYSEKEFLEITKYMINVFKSKNALIDKVYYSPFHPTHGVGKYRKNHMSRKPNPGMIIEASEDLNLNLQNSVLVGDNITDIQAGQAAGINMNYLFKKNFFKDQLIDNCSYTDSLTKLTKIL